MTKIIFINPYEYSYLGTRCLASWLQYNGFETHNILFEDFSSKKVLTPQEGGVIGYQGYQNGSLWENNIIYKLPSPKHLFSLEQIIKEQNPDIIGYSSRSILNNLVSTITPVLKKAAPGALLVAGGYGPTLNPEIYLDAGFDVVIRGDGENAILAIACGVEEKNLHQANKTPGTIWNTKWGGQINKMPDQVKDISTYPPPLSGNSHFSYIENGELFRNSDPILKKSSYYTFFGRGCTGTCSYCSGGQWFSLYKDEKKKAYRRRNRKIEDLISELKKLPANIKTINFCDEYWAMNKKDTELFFKEYKKYIGLPFSLYLNYEQVVKDDDLFYLIISSGLNWTGVGFQTGSSELAANYYNRKNDYKILIEFSHKIFRKKVILNTQFIGGNPYESQEDFIKTIKLIQQLPFSIEEPFIVPLTNNRLKVYPKSPLLEKYPEILSKPMAAKLWHYRAIIMEMARLLPFDRLSNVMKIKKYQNNPQLLQIFYDFLLFNMQYDHFENLIKSKLSENWVYYGYGTAYQRNKSFFAPLNPSCILVDNEFYKDDKIDNIPVIRTEEFFKENDPQKFNFLNFIHLSHFSTRKLLNYNVPFDNIHSCPVNSFSNFFSTDNAHLYRDSK